MNDQNAERFFTGPPDNFSGFFEDNGFRCDPFASAFFEVFEVTRTTLSIRGWLYHPGYQIEAIELPPKWEDRIERCVHGLERADISEKFGNPEVLDSGFEINCSLPIVCHKFFIRFLFQGQKTYTIHPAGESKRLLEERFLRNVGHRYLSWARPLKWKLGLRGLGSASLSPLPNVTRIPSQAKLHVGRTGGEVILPVYDGFDHLEPLLSKLIHDDDIARLIVIDDGSSDLRVKNLLRNAAENSPKIELIENRENLGFVKSVNRGFEKVTDDFVLLNTDVDLPPAWINRLLEPIRRDPKIASTTPFSNAATLLSFPEPGVNNECFNDIDVSAIDRHFQRLRPEWPLPELPTGVGFCMGISKAALDLAGGFDEAFGKGYGEENDWCQRCIKSGFRHVAVPNLYVKHSHGGSFKPEEKNRLLERNLEFLDQRYPDYHDSVQRFIQKDTLAPYRELAALDILSFHCSGAGATLIFDHFEGGGANTFRQQRVASLINNGTLAIVAGPDYPNESFVIRVFHRKHKFLMRVRDETELFTLLKWVPITHIELNSLMFCANPIQIMGQISKLIEQKDLPLDFFVHDYHSLCPSHTLLNDQDIFCNLPGPDECKTCLIHNKHVNNIYSADRELWIESWHHLLAQARGIRVFSEISRDLFLRVHPNLDHLIELKPHDRSFAPKDVIQPGRNANPMVGIVGNIGPSKGAQVLGELEREGRLNMSLLGKYAGPEKRPAKKRIKVHGAYDLSDLPALISQYGINLGFIPSIWPETYNFVADELIAMDLPVVCFDIGAHAQRISQYQKGKVLPLELSRNPGLLTDAILEFWASIQTP